MLDPLDIGDVTLQPRPDGRLTLAVDGWQFVTTTWTVEGVRVAVGYLQAWLAEQPAPDGMTSRDARTGETLCAACNEPAGAHCLGCVYQ
jgi:hypothetical protein